MSNDNTARPTPGPWARNKYGTICSDAAGHETILCADIAIPCGSHDLRSEAVANSELLLEVGNVYHETGLTPRQLAEQRDECVTMLRAVLKTVEESDMWWMDLPDRGGFDADAIRAIIAKVEAKP